MQIEKYLQQSPVFAINASYEAIIPKINSHLKLERLNLLQALVLTALFFEKEKNVTPSQLANVFQTSRGNISHIISDLEYNGYVKRKVDESDARQFIIEIKPEGRKKALSLIKYFDKIQNHFEQGMNTVSCQKTVTGIHFFAKSFLDFKV